MQSALSVNRPSRSSSRASSTRSAKSSMDIRSSIISATSIASIASFLREPLPSASVLDFCREKFKEETEKSVSRVVHYKEKAKENEREFVLLTIQIPGTEYHLRLDRAANKETPPEPVDTVNVADAPEVAIRSGESTPQTPPVHTVRQSLDVFQHMRSRSSEKVPGLYRTSSGTQYRALQAINFPTPLPLREFCVLLLLAGTLSPDEKLKRREWNHAWCSTIMRAIAGGFFTSIVVDEAGFPGQASYEESHAECQAVGDSHSLIMAGTTLARFATSWDFTRGKAWDDKHPIISHFLPILIEEGPPEVKHKAMIAESACATASLENFDTIVNETTYLSSLRKFVRNPAHAEASRRAVQNMIELSVEHLAAKEAETSAARLIKALARESLTHPIILAADATKHLIPLLSLSESPDAQLAAAQAIRELTASDTAAQEAALNNRVIPPLLPLLGPRTSSEALQISALGIISELSSLQRGQEMLLNMHALEELKSVLSADRAPAKVYALQTIAHLVSLPAGQEASVSSGVIDTLVTLLSSADIHLQEGSARAISLLSVNPSAAGVVLASGATKPLVKLSSSSTTGVQPCAIGALRALAALPEGTSGAIAEGAPSVITHLLSSSHLPVQEEAVRAIETYAKHPEGCTAIIQAGAVPVLANLFTSPSIKVQTHATAAMSRIVATPAGKKAAVECGAMDGLAKLGEHLEDTLAAVKKITEQLGAAHVA